MAKSVTISIVLILLALLSTGDGFLIVIFGIVGIPLLVALQLIVAFLAGKAERTKKRRFAYSTIPALVASIAIVSKLSIWVQPGEIFELTMKASKPGSVEEFSYEEDAWTDYSVRFHCRISPDDLKEILSQGHFTRNEMTYLSSENIIINSVEHPWFPDAVTYGYEIENNTDYDGFCTLITNKEHDRIYVVYATN